MSQGVVIYMVYVSDVLLICWMGTQLTKYVRKKWLFLFLFLFLFLSSSLMSQLGYHVQ